MPHTPGPWDCDGSEIHAENLCIANAYRPRTDDEGNWMAIEEVQANARLIAAAPELLDALRSAVRALNAGKNFRVGDDHSYFIATACGEVISKAEGRE